MYTNIAKKLKLIAKIVFIVGTVISVIAAIPMMVDDWLLEEMCPLVLLLLFVGPAISWLASVGVYAFGEVVEKLTKIEENSRNQNN